MGLQIPLSVDKTRVSVAPGASVEFGVTAQNLTTLLDQVTLRVEGVDPAWVEVIPRDLPVFAQGQATARVILRPPRDPATSLAGLYPLRIQAISQINPDAQGETATELEIQLVGDYRLLFERREVSGVEEGSYPFKVQNSANAPLQVRFSGADGEDALWYKFDPLHLAVPAGGEASALLTVRAKRPASDRRLIAFSVSAQGDYALKGSPTPVAAPARQITAQFIQGPLPRLLLSLRALTSAEGREATYDIRVGNPGQAPLTVQLSAADETGGLEFELEPSQLALAAQSEGQARLVVRPKGQPPPGERAFRVTAVPVKGEAQPAVAEGRFFIPAPVAVETRRPTVPVWVIVGGLLLVVLVVLLVILMSRPG
jgi:uncharacterized membrane protein